MAPIAKNKKYIKKKMDTTGESVVSAQLQKQMGQKGDLKKSGKKPERGVVLLRHIPKGFFEDQMKEYFAQFGHVTRVRLARSRRTGGSKCFAFIEFKIPDVAKIAAETMDNYLMFQKLVKAHYIPPEEQKFDYFRTKVRKVTNPLGKSIFTSRKMVGKMKKIKRHNMWSNETYNSRTSKTLKKLAKIKDKYSDLGLDLDSIVIKPKLAALNNSNQSRNEEEQNTTVTSEESGNKPGNLLLVKKRKLSKEEKNESKNKKKQKPSLEQLLGDTINDSDSSVDEDYLPVGDYNPNETLEIPSNSGTNKPLLQNLAKKLEKVESESDSDESYKPPQGASDEDDEDYDSSEEENSHSQLISDTVDSDISEDENEECEENSEDDKEDFKTKSSNKKGNFDKENRLDKLIHRKPLSGAVTKKSIKSKLQNKDSKNKSNVKLNKMKSMMISEIAKNKNLKKVKKSDLKMKSKIK